MEIGMLFPLGIQRLRNFNGIMETSSWWEGVGWGEKIYSVAPIQIKWKKYLTGLHLTVRE
jgi:hypothetical protein